MAEANVADVGIPQGDLAEQADMKAIVGGIDLGFTTFMATFYDAMAQGIEDGRASQRRTGQAADAIHEAFLGDFRSTAAAQNGLLVGASGARQDTLATTEIQTAVADSMTAQARLAEEMNRLNATHSTQRQEIDATLARQQERTAQLENTLSTALASILAKLDAATNPSSPVGPAGP